MIIRDDEDRNEFIKKLLAVDLTKKTWEATAKPYKKNRSAAQNAIFAVWIRDRSKQTQHGEIYERCLAKLSFGVPIMQRHKEFAELWKPYSLMSYEFQLDAMKIVDVTSLMDVSEMNECLTAFEDDCIDNGFHLTRPKLYQEAMQR